MLFDLAVGLLLTQSADHYKVEIVAFLQSLKEAGFVAGQNVAVGIGMRKIKTIGFRRLQPISSAAA